MAKYLDETGLRHFWEKIKNYPSTPGVLKLEFLGRTIRKDSHKSSQGMCVRNVDGSPIIYTCYYNYNTSNEEVVIEAIDFSGNILQTSLAQNLGHANDICYNEKEDVFVVASGASNLYVLDGNTLGITRTVTLSAGYGSITYDYDNDVYYLCNSSGDIVKLNSDFTGENIVGTSSGIPAKQGIEYFDGCIYIVMNSPNAIVEFNVHDNFKIKAIHYIDKFCDGYYPIGEIQCISFYNGNGDFVINGKPRDANLDTGSFEVGLGITAFGRGNIRSNLFSNEYWTQLALVNNYGILHVKSGSDGYVFRPVPDSLIRPFNTIGDAIICLSSPYMLFQGISLNGDFSDEDVAINNKSIAFGGQDIEHPVNVKSISLNNFCGTIRHLNLVNTAPGSSKAIRSRINLANVNSEASDGTRVFHFLAGTVVVAYVAGCDIIRGGKYSTEQSIINSVSGDRAIVRSSWDTLLDFKASSANYEATHTLPSSLVNYGELMITVLRSNGRTLASTVLPVPQFLGGAAYYLGCYDIGANNLVGGVVIYNSATQVTWAANNSLQETLTYRLFAR